MQDFIYKLTAVLSQFEQYTIWVAIFFVTMAFVLIREIVQSTGLALFSAPILMFGALAANYLFTANFLIVTHDKDTNVVVASAVGVVVALTLLLLAIWISVLMSERRTTNKKLKPLVDLPPARD